MILDVKIIREHLLCDGFLRSYTTWTWHGELLNLSRVSITEEYVGSTMDDAVHDNVDDDLLEDMIRDVGAESFAEAHGYGSMSSDAKTPLYPRSTNFTQLSAMLRLMNLKAINGWTNKNFTELLQLSKDMLPKGNSLLNRNYEAKEIPRCGLIRYKLKQKDDDTIEEIEKHGTQ